MKFKVGDKIKNQNCSCIYTIICIYEDKYIVISPSGFKEVGYIDRTDEIYDLYHTQHDILQEILNEI